MKKFKSKEPELSEPRDFTFTMTVNNDIKDTTEAIEEALKFMIFILNGAEGEIKTVSDRLELFDSLKINGKGASKELQKAIEEKRKTKMKRW